MWSPLALAADVGASFAGAKRGRFFRVSGDHVSPALKPGASPMPAPSFASWVLNYATLRHVWASPNTVWALMALALYVFAPCVCLRPAPAAPATRPQ